MSKREELTVSLKQAMKDKDTIAISTIRLILAALKDRDLTARAKGNNDGLSDDEILSMFQTMIKQRIESIKTYKDANRDDLADKEALEVEVIKRFMPKQLSKEEINAAIDASIQKTSAETIKDMGKVMGALKADYAGQIDMGVAGGLVKAKLG